MNDLKCDVVVCEVKKTEKLEKGDMHTVTLLGVIRLTPTVEFQAAGAYAETVAIKVVITEAEQRDLLKMSGVGTKGDMKELVLRIPPQTRLDKYETSVEGFEA